jgi:hypothetical protein
MISTMKLWPNNIGKNYFAAQIILGKFAGTAYC